MGSFTPHYVGGWVYSRADVDAAVLEEKIPFAAESRTPVVQAVA
jgi:hypothetical protein